MKSMVAITTKKAYRLTMGKCFSSPNSSFDQIFLKLVDKVDMDKILDNFEI